LKWRVCGFLDLMIDAANATVVPATGKLIDYDYLYRANVKVRSSNSGSRPPVELSDVDSSGLAIIQSQSHSPTLQLTRGDVGTGGINWYLGRVDNTGNAYLMRNETVLEKYGVDGASLPTLSWPYGQLYVQAPTGVTPQMRWSLADRVGENFYMRMNADVTGAKFDLIHNATTVFSLRNDNSLRLAGAFVMPSFTVTTAPNPSTASGVGAGAMIYVTNGNAGSPCLAVSDGASWKRIALGAAIAAS